MARCGLCPAVSSPNLVNLMHKLFVNAILISGLSLITSAANAGTITGGQIVSNVSAPGAGNASSGVGVLVGSDLIKFVGDINLTSQNGGSSLGNSLVIEGGFSLDPGDAFSLAYDYTVTLVGGGTVSLTTTATTNLDGVELTLTQTELIDSQGTFNRTFTDLAATATQSGEGTWTGVFEFDWTDATAGSSLNITIPNDSIDFAVTSVSTVPEPSSLATLAVASLALVTRRRRADRIENKA